MHVSQSSQIFIYFFNSFSVCPIWHRPPKVHCWDQTFPHRECSRPSFATPSSRPTSSSLHTLSEKFCQFHQVSRSSPVCSDSVLCHSVHIHSPNAHTLAQPCMRAYSHPSLATSVRSVRRYTVCTKHGRSKLPVSVSLRISTAAIYYYIYTI